MRASIIQSDPGYIGAENVGRYRATLNGQPVERVITADEEAGFIERYCYRDGRPVIDEQHASIKTEIVRGEVRIIDTRATP